MPLAGRAKVGSRFQRISNEENEDTRHGAAVNGLFDALCDLRGGIKAAKSRGYSHGGLVSNPEIDKKVMAQIMKDADPRDEVVPQRSRMQSSIT